jgi:hypothetical protein
MNVQCPTCGATVEWSASRPWRPFCSERCRIIDLGAWASEAYRVPTEASDAPESEFTPQSTPVPGRQ